MQKMFYMDTDSFIVYLKAGDIYSDIANDVETRFDTPNYELDRQFPDGKNKKVIGLMKDELGGKIIKAFAALRAKIYSNLISNYDTDENAKDTKSLS